MEQKNTYRRHESSQNSVFLLNSGCLIQINRSIQENRMMESSDVCAWELELFKEEV